MSETRPVFCTYELNYLPKQFGNRNEESNPTYLML